MTWPSTLPHKRKNKYNAVKTVVNGLTFDSKKEGRRWAELLVLQCAGEISDLTRQVRFRLMVNGIDCGAYVCDFTYMENGAKVVEDVKSTATKKLPMYRKNKKLMKAIYGIDIREV